VNESAHEEPGNLFMVAHSPPIHLDRPYVVPGASFAESVPVVIPEAGPVFVTSAPLKILYSRKN
jgi:hypothetical protein